MASATERDVAIIVLARAAPFRLGRVTVNPSTREVTYDGESEIVEPRVMQVLVALADAKGAVVSRDELIARCWEGRIVGDNAINRVLSQIRRLASDFARGSFTLETITKVGYRLIANHREQMPDPPRLLETDGEASTPESAGSRPSRRRFVGGALTAAALSVIGWQGWQRLRGHQPPAEAVDLFHRGEYAQRQGYPDLSRQAVNYLEQAVAIDPLYAQAWGALAVAYRHLLEGFGEAEQASLVGRIRSAAGRALALDPDNGDAKVALVLVHPFYRNWRPMEAALRALAEQHPTQWLVHAQIGLILNETGRIEEGIVHSQRNLENDPMLPIGHMFLARALSMAGRLQEAETVLDRGQSRWPAHPALFMTRFSFLLFNGRPGAAAAFIMNPDVRPSGFPQAAIDRRVRIARAMETRDPDMVRAVIESARAEAAADPLNHQFSTALLAMLGEHDDVFRNLETYFLNGGRPIGRYARRYTYSLFAPPLRTVRADPRFASLLERIGLESFWRETGTIPDYRRG